MTDDQYEINKLKTTLGTLITWIAQSSVAPISISEAEELLKILNEKRE